MYRGFIAALFVLAMVVQLPAAAEAFTITPSFNDEFATNMTTRFRSLGNTGAEEIYLGATGLGDGANREAAQYHWVEKNDFSIVYDADAITDALTVTLGGVTLGSADKIASGSIMNTLVVTVSDRINVTQVDVLGLELSNETDPLGDFIGQNNFMDWTITGLDLSNDFTLTGQICLDGDFPPSGKQETSRVEFRFGFIPATGGANVPVPAPLAMLAAGVLGLIACRRK